MFNDEKLRQEFNRIFDMIDHAPSPTGRLPTKEDGPSFQQLPSRTGLGEEIRKAFAGDGPLPISVDYAEIELRVAADMRRESDGT